MAQITAQQIRQYLQKKGSPLAAYANDFIAVGNKYGIDPRFLVAISGAETGFAKAGSRLANPFGWNSARRYSGPREVLELLAAGLVKPKGYYAGKNTISQIGATWAPPGAQNDAGGNAGWPSAVGQFYREMGGNPSAAVKGAGVATGVATGPSAVTGTTRSGTGYAQLLEMSRQQAQSISSGAGYDPSISAKMKQVILASIANGGGTAGKVMADPGSATGAIAPNGNQPRLSKWGGPEDHGSRALGNWQSDMAYDLGGAAGTAVRSPLAGRVVNISGAPGSPRGKQFAGYGVTVDYGGGRQAFFKHLGSLGPGVKIGSQVSPGALIGGLDATTGGGPHLHLGASSRGFLSSLLPYYGAR